MKSQNIKIGELLVSLTLLTQEQLDEALCVQKESGETVGKILLRLGYLTSERLTYAIAYQQGFEFVRLSNVQIDREAIKLVPYDICKKNTLIPLGVENNVFKVALSDPVHLIALEDPRVFIDKKVEGVIAEEDDIHQAIDKYYGVKTRRKKNLKLGEILVSLTLSTQEQFEEALRIQKKTGKKIGEVLFDLGYVTSEKLAYALAYQQGFEFVQLSNVHIDREAVKIIPYDICKKYTLIPIGVENDVFKVAVSDPVSLLVLNDPRIVIDKDIEGVIAEEQDIQKAIEKYYGVRPRANLKLGELLVSLTLITQEQFEEALRIQKETPESIGQILLNRGHISAEKLAYAVAYQQGFEFVELSTITILPEVLELISYEMCKKNTFIPIGIENNILRVALSDPINLIVLGDLNVTLKMDVEGVIAEENDIKRAIKKYYKTQEKDAKAKD
ncbi:MAG: hypothetical protein ABIH47_01200 [Candidatus Omnitrophota bacterium]